MNTDGSVGARFGATVQATRALAAHQTVTAGGEFIRNAQQDQWAAYDDPAFEGFSLHKASNQAAAFAQDEIKIRPWLLLNGGVRFDAYSNFHRTTPRGAVIVVPSANHSFKYLFGRAFRAPNAYELYYYDDAADRLRPESIGTHELVWEAYEGERLRTSVSAYSYRASDLITLDLEPGTDDELAFFNAGVVHAKGVEFEGELRLKRGVQALASYSLQDAGDVSDASSPLTNSPRHLAKARLGIPGPHRSFTGIEWQFVGRRRTLAGSVDPASTINVTVTAPVTKRIELTAAVRNGLDTHYADPASDEHTSDSIEQNGRTLRVSVRWMWGER